ncbi:MAG: hypothetical protein K0S39_3294 [Paenibacillus sp.]|jgi:hypothetical protein|nr:hypothetical protein [Paenibacillus sp.]
MSYLCTVCNGLLALRVDCQNCNTELEDQGKISDFYDPYSPYRPIEDLKMTNGFKDKENHLCYHWGYCSHCCTSFPVCVHESFL